MATAPEPIRIRDHVQGETLELSIAFTDSAGSAIDLTGATLTLEITAERGGTALASASIGDGITVATPSSGVAAVLVALPGSTFDEGEYQFDITSTIGSSVRTVRFVFRMHKGAAA